MRHLALFLLVIWTLGAVSCDDDSNNSNNINNTNNTNCDCQVTIDTINGRDLMTVNNLIQDQDDQDVNTAGFQIEVAVSFSQTAPCVPEDGSTARLSGGVETMQATITNGQAVFSGYSIPSGNGVLQLIASAGGCSSEPTDILLSTTPVPICAIVSGVTSGTSYSCENDDEVPGQLGLQRLITAQCSNVAQGTTVNFLVDGNMQASGVTGVTGQVSAQVTFPVTAICKDTVIAS
ncbi:hypothetical protein KJ865_03670, partial [Myxococcota bacterium]|nr:hypothetical protein [Myxococcota bacterium]